MKFIQWLAVASLVSMPFVATAQQAPQHTNPLDANAAVPASKYESAFKNHQAAAADEQASPDKAWRAANDEMAKLGGHAGHMKDDDPASSAPAQATQPQAAPMDHSKHH